MQRPLDGRTRYTMLKTIVNSLIRDQHAASKAAGWWTDIKTMQPIDPNTVVMEKLMLVVTEISESAEPGMDDKLPHRTAFEVEIADVVLRVADLMGALGFDLDDTQDVGVFEDGDLQFCTLVHATAQAAEAFRKSKMDKLRSYLSIILLICFNTKGIDLWNAVHEKMAYNARRLDHTLAYRINAEDGKKC